MLGCMSRGGIISGSIVGAVIVGVLGFGAVQVVQAADNRTGEPQVVQVADYGTEAYDPATVLDVRATEAEEDRIEAERVAAEAAAAEAARVAAEQAAAAEAARIAAEQETVTYDEPVTTNNPAPAPAPEPGCPAGYVNDPTRGCHSPVCEVLADGTEVPCVF